MLKLCSIDQAKRQVHQDIDELEVPDILPDLEQKVLAASAAIFNYLKQSVPDFTSPSVEGALYSLWSVTGVPPDVNQATLLHLGDIWEFREGSAMPGLSDAVKALLHRYRDPAMA